MKCNLCGCAEFVDMRGRKNVRCKECHSLERTRLLWMYLQRLPLDATSRVLHIAPEAGIFRKLAGILAPGNYVTADFDPRRYAFAKARKIDLTALEEWPSDHFDLILHVHVLEHLRCNIAYPLYHLHRMLKAGGTHLFIVPFNRGIYEECLDDIGDDERTRRFGQSDHFRRFGIDDLDAHLGKLIRLPAAPDAVADFGEPTLKDANIPAANWRGFHKATVLAVQKGDYRLRPA
jgi:hypothetical protein